MAGNRGSIAFFASYRPPVPLDIYSCPVQPKSARDEFPMTDGKSYNYNGQVIPQPALKTILKRPIFGKSQVKESDVNSAIIFVSERNDLEILHIALTFKNKSTKVKVFSLAEVFPEASIFSGPRMEDGGCFAGVDNEYLVFITTKKLLDVDRRQPWTKVYKTNLITGETKRLTPSEHADLSPAVSPSKKQIAVASFQRRGGWKGEIEDLKTNIYVMNVDKPYNRRLLVENGGWPTWGSENVIFFHRKIDKHWGVYRLDISTGKETRLTPDKMDAVTPAALGPDSVAVATIYEKPDFNKEERVEAQYRQIEIYFSLEQNAEPQKVTKNICSMADHFNPFVVDGGKTLGYHRSIRVHDENEDVKKRPLFEPLESPDPNYELFRLPGVFPSFSKDGTKLAFVDNEFKKVWIADDKGLRKVYEAKDNNGVFSPVWNQNPDKDILYLCVGPSFKAKDRLDIGFIRDVSTIEDVEDELEFLTRGFNNAFPSTSPDGTKLVFRSTREAGDTKNKNLFVVDDIESGLYDEDMIKQITTGKHVDTHCQWAPKGDWIVFSSSRSKNFIPDAPETDNGLDSGYFAIYLVNSEKPDVVLRLMRSGIDFAGHVNHPFFSPDGKSICVTADLAGISVEPISLPLFVHSVRPYGDIFAFDIDLDDLDHHDDKKEFTRITHSRYEYSTATWTLFSAKDERPEWRQLLGNFYAPACPYMQANGGESKHMIGHLCIPFSCC
jgi:Tol biopolymer transport system component